MPLIITLENEAGACGACLLSTCLPTCCVVQRSNDCVMLPLLFSWFPEDQNKDC